MKEKKVIIYNEREIDFNDWIEAEEEIEGLKWLCEQHEGVFVVAGYFGSWQGKIFTGAVVEDLFEAVNWIRPTSADNISIVTDINGDLEVVNHHHDGSSRVVIKKLTKKGVNYYDNNINNYYMNELVEHLLKTKGYTKKVNITKYN